MNEKLNIQNITDELAENYGINKKDAETFVKEFFSIIEEGLEKDKYVKIKGFGTFKLIEVDSRESINVNTGERFEIQGHTKVTFTPDNNIKEAVNKPFSAFQTVVLEEGVPIDAPEVNLTEALSDELPDEETIIQEVNNTQDELLKENHIAEDSASEVSKQEAVAPEENETSFKETVIEEPLTEEVKHEEQDVDESLSADETTENETLTETPVAEDSVDVQILPIFDDEAIKKKDQPVSHQQEVMALKLTEEKRKEISKKAENSSTPYMMFSAVLLVMLCLGILAYFFYPNMVKKEENPVPPFSQINALRQSAEKIEETTFEEAAAADVTASTEDQIQQPTKKVVTEPISVREESVPKVETQSATPSASQPSSAVATQSQSASTTNTSVSKPVAPVSTSRPTTNATTFKVGNTEYVVNGVIEEHVLQKGETLFALSRKYYNANSKYIFIVEYNRDVIKDPDNVPVGTKLKIPRVVKK